jgi:hypothetical protein
MGAEGSVLLKTERETGDLWKARAEAAEAWWVKAAPLMAEIARKHTLDADLHTRLRELMKWEPK